MTYPSNRKSNRTQMSYRSRITTMARTRPMLDLQLGGALWKERRVAPGVKLLALSAGALAMFLFVGVDYLLSTWMAGPLGPNRLSLHPLALSGGSVLCSTLALIWMTPAAVVNLVRLERRGVIPLRVGRK